MRRFPEEPLRSFVAIFTLVLIGFWHGASWNFILFGLFQGVVLTLWRLCENIVWLRKIILNQWVSRSLLFITMSLSLPMFYIVDMQQLQQILTSMLSFQSFEVAPIDHFSSLIIALLGFTVVFSYDLLAEYRGFKIEQLAEKSLSTRILVGSLLYGAILVGGKSGGGEFVYFAF